MKNSLKIGDAVSVKAFVARDGSASANAIDVTIDDGRPLFGGSPVHVPRSRAAPPAGDRRRD